MSLPTDRDWLSPAEYRAYQAATQRSKYGAVPVVIDGVRFASRGEAQRYAELRLLEQAKAISNLRLQVRYPLVVNTVQVASYVADFVYFERPAGEGVWSQVVEDYKGVRTPVYRLKKRLMLACYGIDIRETGGR